MSLLHFAIGLLAGRINMTHFVISTAKSILNPKTEINLPYLNPHENAGIDLWKKLENKCSHNQNVQEEYTLV